MDALVPPLDPDLTAVFPSPAETEAEEPAAEADHGSAPKPHLGDQLHAGSPQLSRPEAPPPNTQGFSRRAPAGAALYPS